jgi:hypothetical protein
VGLAERLVDLGDEAVEEGVVEAVFEARDEARLDDGAVGGLDVEELAEGLGQARRRMVAPGLRRRQMRMSLETKASPSRRRSSRRSFSGGSLSSVASVPASAAGTPWTRRASASSSVGACFLSTSALARRRRLVP